MSNYNLCPYEFASYVSYEFAVSLCHQYCCHFFERLSKKDQFLVSNFRELCE